MTRFFSSRSKAVTFTVAMLLIVLLVGCTNNEGSKSNTNNDTSSNTENNTNESQSQPEPQEDVTITYANFSGAGEGPAAALKEMKQAFEEQNPHITVELDTIGFGEYFTQLQTRVAGGTAPDAYELNYENFVAYAKLGVLEDLEPYFATNNFDRSTIYEQALTAFSSDGVQYGMPASFSNVLLIYNKELFDQANAEYPNEDWTWNEMHEAAVKIRALGDNTFGISQGVHFFEFFKAVQQNGGSLFNDDMTEFTVNSPKNLETLQHMVDRIQKSNVMPTEAQLSGLGDWDLFKDQRLGMILTGVWAFPDFTAGADFEWDIAVEPGNTQKATHFFSNGLVINKDSDQKDAAYKWIEFMSASREAAEIRIAANWELPAVTYPDVIEAYLNETPPANRQAVFDSLEYLVTPPVIKEFAKMNDILTKHLSAASQGAKTSEEALEDAQKELSGSIDLE